MRNPLMTTNCLLALMTVALALPGAVLEARAATKVAGNLVLLSPCNGCPIDGLKKGLLMIRESKKEGAAGLEFQVSLNGATLAGAAANFNAALKIELAISGGACQAFTSPSFAITKGKGRVKFTATSFFVGGAATADVLLCGTTAVIAADTLMPFAAFGLRKGAGGPASFGCHAQGIAFTGEASGTDVLLNWTIGLQSEVDSILIQRRGAETSYGNIGTVPFAPAGAYEFIDVAAPAERNWYRLVVNCADASELLGQDEVIVDLTP